MKEKKIKRLLDKINQLYKHQEIDGALSAIEHDLMLSYIRDLYEQYAFANGEYSLTDNVRSQSSDKTEAIVKPEAVVQKVVEKETVQAPVVIAKEEVVVEVSEPKPEPDLAPESPEIDESLESLFKEESISDLSDKLASQPIKDLSKAMGINEKIFTIQELFNGDQDLFNRTINALNGYNSFIEATFYLKNGVATDQDWASDSKIKKAAGFIKLVRRRYK